jgi:hypothetical protein
MSAAVTYLNARVVGHAADTVRVARGRVAALGGRPQRGDAVVDLDGAFVLPGLINAHDHLELNNFPRLKWRERYANAREWIADFQPRFATDPQLLGPLAVPLPARLFQGGLKNLLSGATMVAHHNPAHYTFQRSDFPVRVAGRLRYSHSLGVDGAATVAAEYRRTPRIAAPRAAGRGSFTPPRASTRRPRPSSTNWPRSAAWGRTRCWCTARPWARRRGPSWRRAARG